MQITNNCIKCGACFMNCPKKAITELETKYEIDNSICINCGNCNENCPMNAIIDE